MSGASNVGTAGSFSAAELTDIRRFSGYPAYGAFGYVYAVGMAYLDTQCAAMSASEQAVVRQYLTALYPLESGVLTAATNMGTDMAAVWTRNRTETADRQALFNLKRRELCAFIGCPPGPELKGSGGIVRC